MSVRRGSGPHGTRAWRYRRLPARPGGGGGARGRGRCRRRFRRASVALNLGEDEAALERGEEGNGEVVRVGAVREVPGGVKTEQPVADGSRPLPESGRDQGAGLRVGLGHLPGERAERAAAPALAALHLGDHHVPPGPEPLWAAEIGLPLVSRRRSRPGSR